MRMTVVTLLGPLTAFFSFYFPSLARANNQHTWILELCVDSQDNGVKAIGRYDRDCICISMRLLLVSVEPMSNNPSKGTRISLEADLSSIRFGCVLQ